MEIRIATRKSQLALWQAEHVAERLRKLEDVDAVTLVPLSTRGDEVLDKSLQKIGGKGLFIKELEVAMRDGRADIAVHSMKDVPAEMPAGFTIAAVLERANPADALVTRDGTGLDDLPQGALVGSSSLRRQAQLLAMRKDLRVEPLRGNVNTRLARLDAGDYQAILLACAGLERLGLAARISEQLAPDRMLPAAAQGVIGIECAAGRADLLAVLSRLDHAATRATTAAERAVAFHLQADCQSPVASFATIDDGQVALEALVATRDGSQVLRHNAEAPAEDAARLGEKVARALAEQGAREIISELAS